MSIVAKMENTKSVLQISEIATHKKSGITTQTHFSQKWTLCGSLPTLQIGNQDTLKILKTVIIRWLSVHKS